MIKKHRFCLSVLIILAIVLGLLVSQGYDLVTYDGVRIVNRKAEIGISCASGKYRLAEMTDRSGQYIVYSIIEPQENGPPITKYVTTDYWYLSRFAQGAYWIEDTEDFYVLTSDTGRHEYRFVNGTWTGDTQG